MTKTAPVHNRTLRPLIAICLCGHRFAPVLAPMPLADAGRALTNTRCPACGEPASVIAGDDGPVLDLECKWLPQ